MVVTLILMVSLMLIFGFCEGVFFLRKLTITVDEATIDRLRAMRELGIPYSAAIRRAVLIYYQYQVSFPPAPKK